MSTVERDKWEGCPYDIKKHEQVLKQIASGIMPDLAGQGFKYHNAHVELAYTWLKEKKDSDMAKGIYRG